MQEHRHSSSSNPALTDYLQLKKDKRKLFYALLSVSGILTLIAALLIAIIAITNNNELTHIAAGSWLNNVLINVDRHITRSLPLL